MGRMSRSKLSRWIAIRAKVIDQVGNDGLHVRRVERRALFFHLADGDAPAFFRLLEGHNPIDGVASCAGARDHVFAGAVGKIGRQHRERDQ